MSPREARLDVLRRDDDASWTLHVHRRGDTATLPSIGDTLVDEVFAAS